MNSFHFTLGSSRVPRVRWFTGLQCGNPWFIATNTLACHYAIPDTMVVYAPGPCVQRTLYSFSVSNPRSPPRYSDVPEHVFASGRWEKEKMKTLAIRAVEYTLSAYNIGDGSSKPMISYIYIYIYTYVHTCINIYTTTRVRTKWCYSCVSKPPLISCSEIFNLKR